ncbi:hypothetical protein [Arthrobacter sp. B6]|uniref:hypothetical protein n=1 Tax=Arthrobacter sp. B6 TaxID=1570137 RepID=UPI00082E2402|nr:hypothetical protein [Arthrobacter sp. B6]
MRTRRNHIELIVALAVTAVLVSGCLGSGANEPGKLATERNEAAGPRTLRPIDGGPGYYGQFDNPLPTAADYFPTGVWLESVKSREEINVDKAVGINLYVDLTADSNLEILGQDDPHVLSSYPSDKDNGAVLADEPDMWAGPGDALWTGNWPGQGPACTPDGTKCGYTLQRQLSDAVDSSKMTYANYGKGVTFWESDDEAAVFVNEFQDVVSADNYWFTDPNICGQSEGGALLEGDRGLAENECRLAANYGWTVDRVRSLVRPAGTKPVWAFIEVGQPFENSIEPVTSAQIRAAVWSSIIHGARGIVYFNHSFGGDCRSFHVLRDPCGEKVRTAVGELNRQLAGLAPVLNAPFLDDAVTHTDDVDTAVKVHDGSLFIFAGSAQASGHETLFELPCLAKGGGTVSVVDEDRTIMMEKGSFQDSFEDGNSVHIYKIEGAAGLCMP